MQNPKLIPVPFANSGIKDDIPKVKSTSMSDEKASWEAGFPEATMLPVYAGGLPPDGKDFNGVLNQISENIVFQSKGGRYKFDPDYALSIGGYQKGATLQTNDESAEYQSLIDNNLVDFNTATPEEIAQAWRITGLGDAIEVLNGKFDKASVKNDLGLSQTEVVSQKVVTELGSGIVGSFESGLNYLKSITNKNQLVTLTNEFGNQLYCWMGAYPKEVPAGSTPESSGGIKPTAWVKVGGADSADIENELSALKVSLNTTIKNQNVISRQLLTNNHILNNSQLELIAHRGFARQFPQNSILAFSMAGEAGATSLECDVQASTDGVLYVFHDLDVSALTNGTGLFREKSSAEIDQLRYKNVQGTIYKDIKIPRFQDVLFTCKERGIKIYAEFSDHMTDANILEYIRLVTYYDAESNVSTQCFNNNKLLFVRQHNKNLELGFLRPTAADYESLIPTLQANAPAMFLMEMNSFLSDSTIAKKCRNANVGLAVWTVQNGTDLARVMRAGCNRVVSDVSLITSKRG